MKIAIYKSNDTKKIDTIRGGGGAGRGPAGIKFTT